MANSDGFRKYFEAGAVLGHVTRARAEEIVRELVNAGEVQRGQAQQWVDDLVERSRKASEELVNVVRKEVANQLNTLKVNPEDLAKQAADILRRSADAGRSATTTATSSAATRVGKTAKAARKAATKVTGRRAGAAKKAGPKPAAKKAPAKKTAAKKAPAKKTAKRAPAKKTAKRPAGGTGR